MKIQLLRNGMFYELRLPKAVIDQAGLHQELDLEVAKGAIIIRSAKKPREGWEEAAIACHTSGEDRPDAWNGITSDST